MDKVTSLAIFAVARVEKNHALFCLVFAVLAIVLPQFMRAMGELASMAIWTYSFFHKFFA